MYGLVTHCKTLEHTVNEIRGLIEGPLQTGERAFEQARELSFAIEVLLDLKLPVMFEAEIAGLVQELDGRRAEIGRRLVIAPIRA